MRPVLLAILLVLLAAPSCAAQPERSVGVITLGNYEKGDSLTFHNRDGSVWLSFDPYFREDESSFSMPGGFRPAGFHPDHFVLMLRSLGTRDSMATVVINEQTGAVKYADLRSHTIKQVSWSEYLTGLFAVSPGAEPIRSRPDTSAQEIEKPKSRLEPAEVQGDWLRVRWRDDETDQSRHGWIRWRDERGGLLIELHHFA